jgi:hypothetical protein
MSSEKTANGPGLDPTSAVGDQISRSASQVKTKAAELGRMATSNIDENRGAAASGLENLATKLHGSAGSLPGGEKVASAAHSAASSLSSTADYIRDHDLGSMAEDVQRIVKNNPGPALLVAAFLGFVVGRAFSKD